MVVNVNYSFYSLAWSGCANKLRISSHQNQYLPTHEPPLFGRHDISFATPRKFNEIKIVLPSSHQERSSFLSPPPTPLKLLFPRERVEIFSSPAHQACWNWARPTPLSYSNALAFLFMVPHPSRVPYFFAPPPRIHKIYNKKKCIEKKNSIKSKSFYPHPIKKGHHFRPPPLFPTPLWIIYPSSHSLTVWVSEWVWLSHLLTATDKLNGSLPNSLFEIKIIMSLLPFRVELKYVPVVWSAYNLGFLKANDPTLPCAMWLPLRRSLTARNPCVELTPGRFLALTNWEKFMVNITSHTSHSPSYTLDSQAWFIPSQLL